MPPEARDALKGLAPWLGVGTFAGLVLGGLVQGAIFAWRGGAEVTRLQEQLANRPTRVEMVQTVAACEADVKASMDAAQESLAQHKERNAKELGEIEATLAAIQASMARIENKLGR